MRGITFYRENREPTPDNPNDILNFMVEDEFYDYIEGLKKDVERLNKTIDRTMKIILDDWNELNTIPIWSVGISKDIRVKLYNELFFRGLDKENENEG